MNLMSGIVDHNKTARISSEATFALPEQMRTLAPGEYRFGVRANHIGLANGAPATLKVAATVELAEISGSETFIHARHQNLLVVVRLEGVHSYQLGQGISLSIDSRKLYTFDHNARLAAAPLGKGVA